MNSIERYLIDPEAPRNPAFSQPALPFASPVRTTFVPTSVTRSDSKAPTASSANSASRYSDFNSDPGRNNSSSSRATSIIMSPHNYGYDLPCEFFFIECNLRFHPEDFEAWISHSASHFVNAPLPLKAICTFCDNDQAVFENHYDVASNWRERMLHIGSHLQDFAPSDNIRPDFWVIEHMREHGLISAEDYAHALKGSERPLCPNMYPLGYETPDMLRRRAKEKKNLQQLHDLTKEQRRMEKELKKGKGTRKSSNRQRQSYNPRILSAKE